MPPNACAVRSLRLVHQPPVANSREQHGEVREQDGGSTSSPHTAAEISTLLQDEGEYPQKVLFTAVIGGCAVY